MRFDDWPERMASEIAAARETPFEWGVHDCGHFTANIVRSITGIDFFSEYRGKYSTRLGLARLLKGTSLEVEMSKRMDSLNWNEIPPMLARRGDIVLINEDDPALGVCLGRSATALDIGGLKTMPMFMTLRAWRTV